MDRLKQEDPQAYVAERKRYWKEQKDRASKQTWSEWFGFAAGGKVDTIPAMLTPGEFVMSADSVKKHGVGLMNRLNKGQVQGFNKGGFVGGVNYLQAGGQPDGGTLDFETQVQKITDGFNVFANAVAAFESVQKDFTMTIAPVNVTLSIVGADVLSSLEPSLQEMVTTMIDNAIPNITAQVTRNQSGGFV